MEMALRPQGPAFPRSRPATDLIVSGGLPQSFLSNHRCSRSRTIQCTVASSDCPNTKSRRTRFPNIKVAAFRGYAPRLTRESSTNKREHCDSDEEHINTYSRLLSTDAPERIGNRKVESTEVDSPHNASSSSTLEKVDVTEKVGLDIFENDLSGDVLDNKLIEKWDKYEAEEETVEVDSSRISLELDAMNESEANTAVFEVDLAGHALGNVTKGKLDAVYEPKAALNSVGAGKVDAMDEAKAKQDIPEFALSRTALSNDPPEEVITVDETKAKKDISIASLLGIAPNIDAMGVVEAIDEAGTEQDIVEVHMLGLPSSNATAGEVDLMDEAGYVQEAFAVDLSYTTTSSGTYAEVDVAGETHTKEATHEMYLSGISSSNSRLEGMDIVDEDSAKKDTFEMALLGGDLGTAKYMVVDSADETVVDEANYQQQYTSLSETSMQVNDIDEAREISKPRPIPLVRDQGPDKLIFSEEVSIQPVVDFHKQEHEVIASDEQNMSKQDLSIVQLSEKDHYVVGSPKQDQSINGFCKHNQSIVSYYRQDTSIVHLPEKDHYIVGSPRQDQSIIGFRKHNQSIVGYYKEDASIVGVPEQTQSIVGFSKPDQSIVASGNQHRSIVRVPEQKHSIVAFCKQDLSIVGTFREVQTKQVAIVGIDDAWHVKRVQANKSQKTDGDTLNVKFDVHSLLQKDKANIIEEAGDMTTSRKVDEEHLLTIEEQQGTSLGERQHFVTEERISVVEVQMKIDEDELLHLFSKEEIPGAKDEVDIIEVELCEVDETSISVELDIRESGADVDPQAHQRMLHELAEKNHSLGNMLFLYPEVVRADSTIDIVLNRDLTTLANEPDVLIKGAFNGWRWRPFTERLHKSELRGGWWCCKLNIPKEAYRLDFVFFNGRTVYENNENNDFVMQIESNMDEHLFEDFLVEEKQKELERVATEEAERRRLTDDQWRKEEERVADEAVRAQAKAEVELKKNKLCNILGLAKISVDNLWYIEPINTGQGSTIRLYYNRSLRSLARNTEIWIHGGYNNWIDGLSFAERLAQHDGEDSEWWFADVVFPDRAYVLDWVFANGPPGNARIFDNNNRQDFHAILPNKKTEVQYWMEEEQRIYTRLLQERKEREEAVKRKAELSAKMKVEMKEKTMRMFLVSQKHIVYTEPLEICAGNTIDVLYNPSNTVLNGKPEVWFRCSFNCWMYPGGVLPPQKMVKAKNGSHLKATVNVPADAYVMDFVFSESEEGGIYDNRNGLDYHIPIFGSIGKEPSMHIVHIAVEMAPIAKVGGLGDVVTSLSRAVQDLGHKVEVILPKHDCLNLSCVRNLHVHESFSWGVTEIRVWYGLVEDVSVYFLEPQNGMFGVGCVYGRNDDRRFGFFCHSALEFLLQRGSSPHIIHCHDWSSAPVAWLCKEHYTQSSLVDAQVVFTIHNLEFGAHYVGKAMKYCDKATTVSNTYSREISSHGAIAPHLGKFFGILNGIDPDIWDPYNDNFIPVHYTSENVLEGKSAAKRALQQKLGLQQNDVPIVGIISRLTAQKGIHLIKHAIHRVLERNGQVVLLGSAPDHRIQNDFSNLASTLHGEKYGRVKMCLTYDEPLSHLIYAGSDFILVPSIFEPCGLTQLVAMRYGAIPIVRKTGGLYDTVFDVEHDKDRARARGLEPNGFSFDGADTDSVDYVLHRAITAWFDAREWFQSLCKRVMEQDWSWNRPALDYIELYRSASKF